MKSIFMQVVLISGLIFAATARADSTYTYTGSQMTNGYVLLTPGVDCTSDCVVPALLPPFCAASTCSITGSITFANPIPDDNTVAVYPESFSFTDGNQTISSANGGIWIGSLATDANGYITQLVEIQVWAANGDGNFMNIQNCPAWMEGASSLSICNGGPMVESS